MSTIKVVMVLKNSKNILIVRLDLIGDFLLNTPLLRELKKNCPHAKITLVVRPAVKNLAEPCPYIDQLLTYQPIPFKKSIFSKIKRYLSLRTFAKKNLQQNFDLALHPRFDCDEEGAALMTNLCDAKIRAGYAQQSNIKYLTHLLEDQTVEHEVAKNCNLLRFLGGTITDDHLESWITDEDRTIANNFLSQFGKGKPRIVLGIGASKPLRMWPSDYYVELCQKLVQARGAHFIIIGSEKEHQMAEKIKESAPNNFLNLTGNLTLRQTGAVIEKCDLYIGSDSGPKHIAVSVGAKVIEISAHPKYGNPLSPNNPTRFGPWRVEHAVVQPENYRAPCTQRCIGNQPHCILGVTPDAVFDEALKLI